MEKANKFLDLDAASKARSIYIRVPGGYGDNLMATAVVAGLHRQYPNLRIFIQTKRMDIFTNNPHIAQCYNTRTLLKKNRSLYERACVIGYPCYSKLRAEQKRKHYIDYMYDCLPLPVTKRCYHPEIYLTQKEKNYKWQLFQSMRRPMVAISPYGGFTSKIPNKFYPLDKWKEIIRLLDTEAVNIIQLGRKKEGPVIRPAQDWRNIGYRRSAAVLLHCDALITHPSGFMHLATALSVPCLTLFAGVEDPHIAGYDANPNLFTHLDCSPCWLERPCENPKCKMLLSPQSIVEATLLNIRSCTFATK